MQFKAQQNQQLTVTSYTLIKSVSYSLLQPF
jgi:hypothetical protein